MDGDKNLSESEIRGALELNRPRKIFEALLEGDMTARELRKKTGLTEENCSENLGFLERRDLVRYDGEKWSATEKAKDIYKKYF